MSDFVICPYCNKEMKQITGAHLKSKHEKSLKELRKEFPNCEILPESVRNKMKETFLRNYGVDNPSKSKKVMDKIKNTFIKKYGTTCSLHNPEIQEKVKKTNREKYGTEYYFASEDARIKIEEANIEKYGCHPRKLDEIKEKAKKTCLEKYGEDNPFKAEEIKNKIRETNIKKYGSSNISSLDFVKEKKRNTFLQKYIPKINGTLEALKLELLENFINGHYPHNWRCLVCETTFKVPWYYIYAGYKCPNCFPRNTFTSLAENEIKDFVKNLGFDIIENDRNIINPKELDIVIPEKQVAIEYCGLYWHSDEQKEEKYHVNKLNETNKKGYRLILIFEDEWILKKDLVKNRLRHILNKHNGKRLHARNCNIIEISPQIKNSFLDSFHLQGHDSSIIKLGAFYKNELVAVMTFSHGNIAKGSKPKDNIWELNRFCSNYNYHIPGIASKLLEHFKRNYEWKEIFSYADRRWSSGNMYEKLGFKFEKITNPNYWYISGTERIHRFKLRKRFNEPKDISESILRLSEGYIKIFDCGNIKYTMKK